MSEYDSHALWIIPKGAAYDLTRGYITKLSAIYHLPEFEPHITVLSDIRSPDISAIRGFAGSLAPLCIHLDNKVQSPDSYFRSLHLRAQETPELMELFSKARERFGSTGESYFPHLSLAYSGFNHQTKRKMIQDLGEIPEIEFEVHQLTLFNASPNKPVSHWKVIERFKLGVRYDGDTHHLASHA